jgi:hypothetical protein
MTTVGQNQALAAMKATLLRFWGVVRLKLTEDRGDKFGIPANVLTCSD